MISRLDEIRLRSTYAAKFKALSFLTASITLYIFCIFGFHSEQTYPNVVRHNRLKSQDEWMERYYRLQFLEMAHSMNRLERLRLDNEAKDALKLWKYNRTSVNLQGRKAWSNSNSTSADIGIPQSSRYSRDWILIFLVIILVLRRVACPFLLRHLLVSQRIVQYHQQALNQVRFQHWVQQLNQHREARGERPLSLDTLRLVLQDQQFRDGTDYEGLLDFQDEAGPAMASLIRRTGATEDAISRLPSRILEQGDHLLESGAASFDRPTQCPICLEEFLMGDEVRALPCFHTFHKNCIDQWLLQKGLCPVCKHTAISQNA
jgi:Ring finger domain